MLNITLTSDFGIQSHPVASIKGKLLSAFGQLNIIDITHTVRPFDLQQGAYLFKQAYGHFPKDSFHLIYLGLHHRDGKQLLYAYENGQHIFCADNGFMTLLFDDKPARFFKLTDRISEYDFLHVTDLFLSNIAGLMHGNRSGLELVDVHQIVVKHPVYATHQNHVLEAQVQYIDNYGNVILNLTRHQFEEAALGRKFRILFMRDEEINTISRHYSDVPEGDKLCLFNTSGHLEIAIHNGDASQLFGFHENGEKSLLYNRVKIFFE
ncbi:MAG: SAM-dependent chlorinase/fluorinase [Chitinophagaceae bacterium]|nr:SAM-dependent chlorinase/fluorinase [Chitinophagaceae bacterium]